MYYFHLGSHPELSQAELEAILPTQSFTHPQPHIALCEDLGLFSLEQLQNRLAGTVKSGEVIGAFESLDQQEVVQFLANWIENVTPEGKIHFGVSVFGDLNKQTRDAIGIATKKELKDRDRSVRFVSAKEIDLSAVIIRTNKLLDSAGDFVLIQANDQWLVAHTQSAQDFQAWSHRDFGRPERDAKSGMLPPKLARLMINLSGIQPENHTLLDPFCGSGTVLMEAALLGFPTLIGNDLSPKAISDTQTNMQWLETTMGCTTQTTLITGAAELIPEEFNQSVDLIVGETTLGPPLGGNEYVPQIQKNVEVLIPIYRESLKRLSDVLKKDAPMIMAFPLFSQVTIPLERLINEAGFTITGRWSYKRANQHVGRDIIRMTHTP